MIKKFLLLMIGSMILSTTLSARKDVNILSYIDRGIKYYPKYVKRGLVKFGKASWYGKPFHKRLTANGERYNMYHMTAAHRTYAMNTILKVTNLDTKKSVRVRVNDRGPFYRSRDIDLSYGAAKKIGMTKKGVGRVKIEVISGNKSKRKFSRSKNRIVKSKKYAKVKRVKKRVVSKKVVKKTRVQLASFYNMKNAKNFKKKHNLKDVSIVKTYISSKKRTAYRVVVEKTSFDAKKLLKSKKFKGAYILS
ncbi:MAG TPA: septal ring lytic transglycosylase RlpA family protein [Campylobacterales bacterium]|nr:septal ring lytic transglycosylase RlpA family protein [Campylobacterales bacterium]